jgi:hypothetical protein
MKYVCISDDVQLGRNVMFSEFINLYGCYVGETQEAVLLLRFKRMPRLEELQNFQPHLHL